MSIECPVPPNCPIPPLKEELRNDINELKADVKELIKNNAQIHALVVEISAIRDELRDVKSTTLKSMDSLFDRLRNVETSYVSKSDVKTFGIVMSIIFTVINIIIFIMMRK